MDQFISLSVFSGIGGFDLAGEQAGMRTVAFCERDAFCRQILRQHWPGRPIYDDIHTLTRSRLQEDGIDPTTIDLITGGPPCQDASFIGRRLGESGTNWLWPQFLRLCREILPRWILAENPHGLLSVNGRQAFKSLLEQLGKMGYRVGWAVYGAHAVGAPHHRDRVFLIAYHPSSPSSSPQKGAAIDPQHHCADPASISLAHSISQRANQISLSPHGANPILFRTHSSNQNHLADSYDMGCQPFFSPSSPGETTLHQSAIVQTQSDPGNHSVHTSSHPQGEAASLREDRGTGHPGGTGTHTLSQSRVDRIADGISSWLDQTHWPARPGESLKAGEPVRLLDTSPKERARRLRALGNAVVPQQVYPILRWIKEIDSILI